MHYFARRLGVAITLVRGDGFMAAAYYFERQGQRYGPFTSEELRQKAETGQLAADDVIFRENSAEGRKAGVVYGLMPGVAPVVPPVPYPPSAPTIRLDGSAPRVARRDEMPQTPGPLPHTTTGRRIDPYLQHLEQRWSLGRTPVVAVLVGAVALALTVLAAFLTWEAYYSGAAMNAALPTPRFEQTEAYEGVKYLEGKLVAALAVVGFVALVVGGLIPRWLPGALILAAAVSTCAFLVTWSYDQKIDRYVAGQFADIEQMKKNMGAVGLGKNFMEFGFKGGAAMGLYLALVGSLTAALVLGYASVRRPVLVPALQQEGVPAWAQSHGALVAAETLAVLVAVVVLIARY
jgi:hypothetical protein